MENTRMSNLKLVRLSAMEIERYNCFEALSQNDFKLIFGCTPLEGFKEACEWLKNESLDGIVEWYGYQCVEDSLVFEDGIEEVENRVNEILNS